MRTLPHAVSILDFWGPNAKLCQGGNGGWLGLCWVERLDKRICPCFTLPRIALTESTQETVAISSTARYAFKFYLIF